MMGSARTHSAAKRHRIVLQGVVFVMREGLLTMLDPSRGVVGL